MGYTALYLPAGDNSRLNKSGFKTEDEAWEYIASQRCDSCQEKALIPDGIIHCDGEWTVATDEDWQKCIEDAKREGK